MLQTCCQRAAPPSPSLLPRATRLSKIRSKVVASRHYYFRRKKKQKKRRARRPRPSSNARNPACGKGRKASNLMPRVSAKPYQKAPRGVREREHGNTANDHRRPPCLPEVVPPLLSLLFSRSLLPVSPAMESWQRNSSVEAFPSSDPGVLEAAEPCSGQWDEKLPGPQRHSG